MNAKLCKDDFSKQLGTCKATRNSCFQASAETTTQEVEYTYTKDNLKKIFLGVGPPKELSGVMFTNEQRIRANALTGMYHLVEV